MVQSSTWNWCKTSITAKSQPSWWIFFSHHGPANLSAQWLTCPCKSPALPTLDHSRLWAAPQSQPACHFLLPQSLSSPSYKSSRCTYTNWSSGIQKYKLEAPCFLKHHLFSSSSFVKFCNRQYIVSKQTQMLKIYTLCSFTDLVCNFSKCDAHGPKNAHLFLGASLTF